jgi:nitroreductase
MSRSNTACCCSVAPTSGHKPACRISSVPPPLNLIYVAHGEGMQDISPEDRRLYASADSCFIGQNVYLFCASEGLATVFRGAVDTAKLGQTMELGKDQFVTFAQTVGYP